MGKEASALNEALVEGREVVLERDVSETDRYDRLLRYLWIGDGGTWTLVNLALLSRRVHSAGTARSRLRRHPFRGFEVVGSDRHRFDGEGDGIGCERG